MLEALDTIDWSATTHAYGPATDVPELLRALATCADEACEAPLWRFYGNIYHQGTRYPATPLTIPFLVEIAAASAAPKRAKVLELLTACVTGWLSVSAGPFTARGPLGRELAEAAAPEASDDGTRAQRDRDLELLRAIEAAAAPAIPAAITWLSEPDPKLRAAAACFLASFAERAVAAGLPQALAARLAVEPLPELRAALIFALGHVLPYPEDHALRRHLADSDPLPRIVAALLLVRRRGAGAPTLALERVCALLNADAVDEAVDQRYRALPWETSGLASDAAAVLQSAGRSALQAALPTLIERLREVDDFAAVQLLEAALEAAFGDAPPPTDAADLGVSQRVLLEALVANDAGFWSVGNALHVLGERGLPSVRTGLAAWLGVTYEEDRAAAELRSAKRYRTSFGDLDEARAHLDRALALDPQHGAAWAELGDLLMDLGEMREALAALDRAAALGVDTGELHFGRAVLLYDAGALDEAAAAFMRAAEGLAGDDRCSARSNAAMVLRTLGRGDACLAAHRRNVEEFPESHAAWYGLGLAEVKLGAYDGCVASITRALELDPTDGNAHYTIACAYALRGDDGDDDRAVEHAAAAIVAEPELRAAIAGDDDFASLADDPRFQALIDGEA